MSENEYYEAYTCKLRERFVQIGKLVFDNGLTSGCGGQLSARIPGTEYLMVKPTGFCLGRLRPEDMLIVDFDGKIIEGNPSYRPTGEMPFHTALYRARKDIKAIVHAHPPIATAFGIAGVDLLPIWIEAFTLAAEGVKIAEFAAGGTEELGPKVVEAFGKERWACILEWHGIVAGGDTLEAAYQTAKDVEWLAKMQMVATIVGKPRLVPEEAREMARKWQRERHGHPMYELNWPPIRIRYKPY